MQTSEVDTYDEPCATVCGPVDFGGRYAPKRDPTDSLTHGLTHSLTDRQTHADNPVSYYGIFADNRKCAFGAKINSEHSLRTS